MIDVVIKLPRSGRLFAVDVTVVDGATDSYAWSLHTECRHALLKFVCCAPGTMLWPATHVHARAAHVLPSRSKVCCSIMCGPRGVLVPLQTGGATCGVSTTSDPLQRRCQLQASGQRKCAQSRPAVPRVASLAPSPCWRPQRRRPTRVCAGNHAPGRPGAPGCGDDAGHVAPQEGGLLAVDGPKPERPIAAACTHHGPIRRQRPPDRRARRDAEGIPPEALQRLGRHAQVGDAEGAVCAAGQHIVWPCAARVQAGDAARGVDAGDVLGGAGECSRLAPVPEAEPAAGVAGHNPACGGCHAHRRIAGLAGE